MIKTKMTKEVAQEGNNQKISFFEQDDHTVSVKSSIGDEYQLFADTPGRLYSKCVKIGG